MKKFFLTQVFPTQVFPKIGGVSELVYLTRK